jgi:hypothetical protein
MSEEELRALLEIDDEGGSKRWLLCQFSASVAYDLAAAKLISLGDPSLRMIHLTDAGREVLRRSGLRADASASAGE